MLEADLPNVIELFDWYLKCTFKFVSLRFYCVFFQNPKGSTWLPQGRRLRFASGMDNYGERSEHKNFFLAGDNSPEKSKLIMLE
jgi:hypothetical protein